MFVKRYFMFPLRICKNHCFSTYYSVEMKKLNKHAVWVDRPAEASVLYLLTWHRGQLHLLETYRVLFPPVLDTLAHCQWETV